MNILYLAKPRYGGWITFTAHLSLLKKYPIFKITKKGEKKHRPFGYSTDYRNINIEELKSMDNIIISAIDKNFYQYLEHIEDATIVIHDPTELKPALLAHLERFNIITIRESVQHFLMDCFGISSVFIPHPFYCFPREPCPKDGAISISRIDYDKHTDIILKPNEGVEKPILIYGAVNDLYVYHKLKDLDFKHYYKGSFPKCFEKLKTLLEPMRYCIDMSVIKKDGGGSQYTFLEAIYCDCILVINKKWVDNMPTEFVDGINCIVVKDHYDLIYKLTCFNKEYFDMITMNARLMLDKHIKPELW